LFLVYSLLAINCATFKRLEEERKKTKKRHGAVLIIQKKDGQRIEGELITVKPNSLLLLSITGRDVSVGIADIKVIRIVKKSKFGKGAAIGGLVGAAGGVASLAALMAALEDSTGFEWYIIFGAVGASICAVVGGLIGALFGIDKTIQIEGMSEREISDAMNKLRKKARIRDYK